jgi:hypothetical protein
MDWSGGLVEWVENDTVYISVAFSWRLPDAHKLAQLFTDAGRKVRAGGPGLFARGDYMADVAELGGSVDALSRHNPNATIASRGCPVGCYFCIVPKMEGKEFTLLPDFTPRPILCDNNVSALPVEYQKYIIEKYQKSGVVLKDINSGFEPKTFDADTYQRWKTINHGPWRFGYDETKEEPEVYRMTQTLKTVKASKKRAYVLIGNEPFENCYRRIMQVIEWGCEPHVQPMIALNALEKKPIIRFDWTERKLKDLARWSNTWIWRTVKFEDYRFDYVNRITGTLPERKNAS